MGISLSYIAELGANETGWLADAKTKNRALKR